MRKIKFLAIIAMICILSLSVFVACGETGSKDSNDSSVSASDTTNDSDTGESETGSYVQLEIPEIVLTGDFSVSWTDIGNATGYVVNVNGEDLSVTASLTFPAFRTAGTYAIKVKAVSESGESEYSEVVNYSVYSVDLASGEGFELTGDKIVYGGKNYSFALEIKGEAYEGSQPVVKVNGEVVTAGEDGKYTVENVSANLAVTVEGIVKTEYTVTIPTGEGYEVKGALKVTYGEDYSFEVNKLEGYDMSELTVKVNGNVVAVGEDGKYLVESVKENLTITVEGATKNTYTVTLPESVAFTVTGEKSVVYGADYTFRLTVSDKYDKTNLVVKVNGAEVAAEEDGETYIVKAVKENLVVTVEGLDIKTYDVTLTAGTGYELKGEAKAEHGGDYTFELTLTEGYTNSTPVVKANGEVLATGEDGKYTVVGVTGEIIITVENVKINVYTVSVSEGEGYVVDGENEKEVNYGEGMTFAIAATNAEDVIKVFNGEEEIAGENGVYTVANVKANVVLTVKVYDLAAQMLLNWNLPITEKADGTAEISCKVVSMNSAWVEKLLNAGYTHIKYDMSVTGGVQIALTHSGTWNKYWRILGATDTVRIDLTEFKDGESYFGWSMEVRDSASAQTDGVITVAKPVLYKSEETTKWTKSNSSIYCAIEDGYIILDTRCAGNDAHVLSTAEWWKRYAGNPIASEVSQNTIVLMGKYLNAGSNNRGAVFGGAGAGVGVIGGTANTEFYTEYMNNLVYTEGSQFYLGMDKEGVYQAKVGDFVSNRNSWGGFSVEFTSENSFKLTMPDGGKFLHVFTQDMIAAGYSKIRITASEYTSGQVWIGNDNWGGGMAGLNSGETKELDLSIFTEANPYFQVFSSGNIDVTITYEFIK